MSRSILVASLLTGLFGCQRPAGSSFDGRGVFVAYLPAPDAPACASTITENVTDADPPEVPGTLTSSWLFEDESIRSDSMVFVQIFDNSDGTAAMQLGDRTWVGQGGDGVTSFEWTRSQEDTERATNDKAGYAYVESQTTAITDTIELTEGADPGTYEGTWTTSQQLVVSAEESDLWDAAAGNYYYTTGQINAFIFTWLVGGASNNWDAVDCQSDPCFVTIEQACEGSFDFTLVETDLDPAGFDGVRDAGQPFGAP